MVIVSAEQVSPDCVKITTSAGPSFFIRLSYLLLVPVQAVCSGAQFSGDEETDIIDAGIVFGAEKKAVDYLARAEQCRFGLTAKLTAKGFDKKSISRALDYLEQKEYLSDARFARAWLNNRKISKSEGRIRLAAELASRGICKETAASALDEFFENTSEEDLCRRAFEKCHRLGKDREKTQSYLQRCGFSFKLIETVLNWNN